jgi:hypothetical protein
LIRISHFRASLISNRKNILDKLKKKYIWGGMLAGVFLLAMGLGIYVVSSNRSSKITQKSVEEQVESLLDSESLEKSVNFKDTIVQKEKSEIVEETTTAPVQVEESTQVPHTSYCDTNDCAKSPLSGLKCQSATKRPIGVMVSTDKPARPLSGLSKADMVFEMPVITGSVTRIMGIFVCNIPEQVGSVRSARHDFISLIRGLDGMYAHWGGSHFALDELSSGKRYTGENLGKIDDFNALSMGIPFYRVNWSYAPHNGFVNLVNLVSIAKSKGYRTENNYKTTYQHLEDSQVQGEKVWTQGDLRIGYSGSYGVRWDYNPELNEYTRFWNGVMDMDRYYNVPIKAKTIISFKASSRQIEGQYNTIDIYGSGEASYFMNGKEYKGVWEKKDFVSPLIFKDTQGNIQKFVPGLIWVEIVEPSQTVSWTKR